MKRVCTLIPILLACIVLAGINPVAMRVQGAPALAESAIGLPSSGCAWYYYPGASGQAQPLWNDPDATLPPVIVSTSGYRENGAKPASNGYLDFDADGKTDLFRAALRPDGFYQWQYSPNGTGAWRNLAYDATQLDWLRFGDFDGDGKTDVFGPADLGNGTYQWRYSSGGNTSYQNMRVGPDYPANLGVGNFDGNNTADIFIARYIPGPSNYQWLYSSGGTGAPQNLSVGESIAKVRFGDFNGDGKTDVFSAPPITGGYQYRYSSGGTLSNVNIFTGTIPLERIRFGDFDGDNKTDLLTFESRAGVLTNWVGRVVPSGNRIPLATVDEAMPLLGDFDGNGKTDAFVQHCTGGFAYQRLPAQPLTELKDNITADMYVGDINGDKRDDVIFNDLCVIAPDGYCDSAPNHTLTARSNGDGTFNAAPLQVLSTDGWDDFRTFWGDVNADGRPDFLWSNTISDKLAVSLSDINGGFSTPVMQENITTEGASNDAAGDFNGDGRLDLVWNSICLIPASAELGYGCSTTSDNKLYVGYMQPGGTIAISSLQSLGSGWADYNATTGDFNGDGKDDLIWNSVCQKVLGSDFTCTGGDANYLYVGLSNGQGGFDLTSRQTYETSGWQTYSRLFVADVNGDKKDDVVWVSKCQVKECSLSTLMLRVGISNGNGTFVITPAQKFPVQPWNAFRLTVADVNGDGKDDILWNRIGTAENPYNDLIVTLSNSNGTFQYMPPMHFSGINWDSNVVSFGIGDVNADGVNDLVWRTSNRSGPTLLSTMLFRGREAYVPLIRR